jgi:outer membrane receptor for ferrienterochelin and colicins
MCAKIFIFLFFLFPFLSSSQNTIRGIVTENNETLAFANIYVKEINKGVETNKEGRYEINSIPDGDYTIVVSFIGYKSEKKKVTLTKSSQVTLNFNLQEDSNNLDEVVVSGTLKPVSRMETPVPVEVYTTAFLKKTQLPIFLKLCKM